MRILDKIFGQDEADYLEQSYVDKKDIDKKIKIRIFNLENIETIDEITKMVREGKTIALINIKPLKDKDFLGLKVVMNRLKKHADAMSGDIAGLSEDWVVMVPNIASIER
jgi:SepF-like predicted cell division protein (DUF552 family)